MLDRILPISVRAKRDYNKKLKKVDTEVLQKNKTLISSQVGKRCFIVGNGPSIKRENLALLADEVVFTVNDMYLYDTFGSLNTNYHLLIDPLYFGDFQNVVIKINSKCATPPTVITSIEGSKHLDVNAIPNQVIVLESGYDIDYLRYIGLHVDGLLPYYCTVIQYALSLAIEMGYSEIYLLGCDCTGIENYIQRKKGELPKSYCFDMSSEDEKKLLGNSTIMSSEHAFYEWYHIFKSYRLLSEVAKSRSIKIVDLTQEGILDVFEKNHLDAVLTEGDNE